MDPVIDVEGLVKDFGSTRALDGLDLRVAPGEVHGFLGPNGSGKSTTIRVLLGLLRADGGRARLLGGDPWRDAVSLHRRLAYVPGDVDLWPTLTGGEVIDLMGRLRGGLDPGRRTEMLERFDLDPTKKARTYSKGNRQKVALVAALASEVELLVLDEPTAGLDPLMEATFQDCIREARDEGRTVLLSSHILAEVEALCDRVSIIRLGATVESGTLDELRHLTRTAVDVETASPPDGLDRLEGVHDLVVDDHRARFDVDTVHLGAAVERISALGIRSLTSHPPTLEELFLRHYGDTVTDEGVVADDDAPAGRGPAGAVDGDRAAVAGDGRRAPEVEPGREAPGAATGSGDGADPGRAHHRGGEGDPGDGSPVAGGAARSGDDGAGDDGGPTRPAAGP